jgi:hypothetical protein
MRLAFLLYTAGMNLRHGHGVVLLLSWLLAGCAHHPTKPAGPPATSAGKTLVGAWIAQVHFKNGPWAAMSDLEFLYAFNTGGTMTESSNYDGAPPVPPAYGIWRAVAPNEFEAKYVFFQNKPPQRFAEIAKGAGWLPEGAGTFTENIRLSPDGHSFKSRISYTGYDSKGKPLNETMEAETMGMRIDFGPQ